MAGAAQPPHQDLAGRAAEKMAAGAAGYLPGCAATSGHPWTRHPLAVLWGLARWQRGGQAATAAGSNRWMGWQGACSRTPARKCPEKRACNHVAEGQSRGEIRKLQALQRCAVTCTGNLKVWALQCLLPSE
eukprot:1157940-Pelagomonas_calceolata.AAC.9